MRRLLSLSLFVIANLNLTGCALVEKISDRIAENLTSRMQEEVAKRMTQGLDGLTKAIINHDDPGTIIAGVPSYLIMLDGLLTNDPNNVQLLMAASRLYGAYAGALTDQPDRAKRLTQRAFDYAGRALCQSRPDICKRQDKPFDQFKPTIARTGKGYLEPLYVYGAAWAGWLQARPGDYDALAQLPKIEYIFTRITAFSPNYDHGRVQLYLGIMRSQIPPSLGGKPETAKQHFEQAIKQTQGRDLVVKVKYARYYARLVYDEDLHNRLLDEVLKANPKIEGFTLSNVMAQQEARALKSDDFF